MLSEDQLAVIYATKESRRRKPEGKGTVFVRSEEGLNTAVIKRMGDWDLGTHVGNVGTTKRSRKGRTYKAPNGVRKYQPHDYDRGAPTVVAYKLKRR